MTVFEMLKRVQHDDIGVQHDDIGVQHDGEKEKKKCKKKQT